MLSKTGCYKASGALALLFLFCELFYAQDNSKQNNVRLMFYNVENLFDIYNDSLKADDEFLPGGLRRWNHTRYINKLNSIYKTIIAAGDWEPPAIVAFCEIENRRVLDDLINLTYLSKYNYGIIHEESPDERGIDVCFIFRKDIVHVLSYSSLIPFSFSQNSFKTRSVLYAKCAISTDTVHLMINHWPSRRGGVLAAGDKRMAVSQMVRSVSDSLYQVTSGMAKIIIMGDFNCTPDDPVIKHLINGSDDINSRPGPKIVNLAESAVSGVSGTYNYLGAWEIIDQILVSEQLLTSMKGLSSELTGFRIFNPDFLLKEDPKYPGKTTYSTYRGYRYQGGYSDHLPVLLDLTFR